VEACLFGPQKYARPTSTAEQRTDGASKQMVTMRYLVLDTTSGRFPIAVYMFPSRTLPSILTGSEAIRINIIRAHWSVLFHHWWMLCTKSAKVR
jgi:hypothetical protein